MNVLIVNAYSALNRGDGMIVAQMVELFRARGCDVAIMSDDPRDAERYDCRRVPPLIDVWPRAGESRTARPRRALAQIARTVLRPGVPAALGWADVCVSAGGGYLYDDGSRSARISLALRLLTLRACRRAGKPVVLFSQSIGPFASKLATKLVGRELRRAALTIVREERSLEVCRCLGVRSLTLCDDAAFNLRPQPRRADAAARLPAIGVTVMGSLPGSAPDGVRRYREALVDGLVAALRGREEEVAVISQVSAHAIDDDVDACRSLVAELRERGLTARFADLADRPDDEVAAFYGTLQLVVASRLHSAILALCALTPVVGLSYLPKADGVFARAGLSEYLLSAHALDADELAARVTSVLESRAALSRQIEARLGELRRSAASAADHVLELAQQVPPARSRSC